MRELGWEVAGIEPDPVAARVARDTYRIVVHAGDLQTAALPRASFDAVVLSHVIEHVRDPVRVLEACGGFLQRGGHLVLLTPNIESLGHRVFRDSWITLDPPRHLVLFAPRTLAGCCRAAGLEVTRAGTSTRIAPWRWAASRALRSRGVLPNLDASSIPRRYTRIEGRVFWIVEHLLSVFGSWGEDAVVICRKTTRRAPGPRVACGVAPQSRKVG
ncbi:MAG: class I SAM-dependent methyltransferase, partial [Candidatus Krumholzibacteriia bacterium]